MSNISLAYMTTKTITKMSAADLEAGTRLRKLWDEKAKGLELTQEKAGDKMEISQGAVSQYLNSKIPLNLTAVIQFAKMLEVNPREIRTDLAGLNDEPATVKVHAYSIRAVDGNDGLNPATDVQIPVYDIEVSGGPGAINIEYVETKYELPYQMYWLNKFKAKPEDILIYPVRGSSMDGVAWHGDKVIVHTKRKKIINDCVYVFAMADGARVKRLQNMTDGRLRVMSENSDKTRYPDEYLTPEQMEGMIVIGQVIDKSGPGGLGL